MKIFFQFKTHFLIFCIFLFLFCCISTKYSNISFSNNGYLLNVSGSNEYNPYLWKPHSYNLKNAEWKITFSNKVNLFLNNNSSEFGHIACGSWWTPNFKDWKKLPLKNIKSLPVSVDVFLSKVDVKPKYSLLRIAIASSINIAGQPRFTELDFWNSKASLALLYEKGNMYFNGKDEYSYKIKQIKQKQWYTLSIDILPYIKKSWGDLSEVLLECIYIVIESDCRENENKDIVSLDVKNLFIHVVE